MMQARTRAYFDPEMNWVEWDRDRPKIEKVNRVEMHHSNGTSYVAEGVTADLVYQDGGKTLKIFLEPGEPVVRPKGWLK